MMNERIQDGFNDQLNYELYSAYIYLSMSAHFESINLKGMALWMRLQAQEEVQHAAKFFDYINERGGKVVLKEIKDPQTEWNSPVDAFEDAYKHECKVSARINDLVNLAVHEKDHASNAFLQWFVTEQVEEEAAVLEIAEQLKLGGDQAPALFMIDRELGQRTPPAASEGSE